VALEVVGAVGAIAPRLVTRLARLNVVRSDASAVRINVIDIDIQSTPAERARVGLVPREDEASAELEDSNQRLPGRLALDTAEMESEHTGKPLSSGIEVGVVQKRNNWTELLAAGFRRHGKDSRT
jgi:hypothetical protein